MYLRTLATLSLMVLFLLTMDSVPQRLSAQSPSPTPLPHSLNSWRHRWANPSAELTFLSQVQPMVDRTFGSQNRTAAATSKFLDWWWFVLQSSQDGHWEIYRLYPMTRLTHGQASNHDANLSRDTSKIVFVSERDGNSEIYRMQSDGGEQTRLTSHIELDTQPVWSPDGSQVVFLSRRDGNAEIYRMNADGSDLRRLTVAPQTDLSPSWSPDGKQVIWIRVVSSSTGKIWVMNADGNNPRPLTGELRYVQHPIWSPDGTLIAFDHDADNDNFNEIALINSNGSGLQLLMDGGSYPNTTVEELWASNWLPEGKGVAISTFEFVQDGSSSSDPYRFNGRTYARGICFVEGCSLYEIGAVNPTISQTFMQPSVQNRDPYTPISRIRQLPSFSRAADLWLEWSAVDIGPAGVDTFDLQFRNDQDPTWRNFQFRTQGSQFVQQTESGDIRLPGLDFPLGTLSFRVRARDQAENLEAWSASGQRETTTTIFATRLKGSLSDQRGNPKRLRTIPITPAPITPLRTDSLGTFATHMADAGGYILDNRLRLNMRVDQQVVFYVPPVAHLLSNGNFEDGLTHWNAKQISGTTITGAVILSSPIESGNHLLKLGLPCSTHCMPRQEITARLSSAPISVTLTDAAGTIHLLAIEEPGYGPVLYQTQPTQGDWSPPATLISGTMNHISAIQLAGGELHVVALSNGTYDPTLPGAIHYVTSKQDNQWSTPISVTVGGYPQLTTNQTGVINLVYSQCSYNCTANRFIRMRTRTKTSDWSTEIELATGLFETFSSATLEDGSLHVLWQKSFGDRFDFIWHLADTLRDANGHVVTQTMIDSKYASLPRLLVAPDQSLHALWYQIGTYHARFSSEQGWEQPQLVAPDVLTPDVAATALIDAEGTLHLRAGPTYYGQSQITTYRFKALNRPWSSVLGFEENAIDRGLLSTNQPITATISQSLTIPGDLHKPTLSFLYQLWGGTGSTSRFVVTLASGLTSTQVFSTNATTPWQLGWADLSEWLGQSVTVTFAVEQDTGSLPMQVALDDISIGDWIDPVVHASSPPQVEYGIGGTLTIRGENFIETPSVRLSKLHLNTVRWLDETRLEVNLPTDLAAGRYDVVVVNPAGQESVLPAALVIGKEVFFPMIGK